MFPVFGLEHGSIYASPEKELWVVEPPVAAVEDPPVKRVLVYPIVLRYSDVLRPVGPAPSPPPSSDEGDDDDEDSTWRRRRI